MSVETDTNEPASPSARAQSGSATGGAGSGAQPPHPSPADSLREAIAQFAKLREFAAYYAATRLDAVRLTVRQLGITLGLLVFAALAALSIIVTAVVLLMRGISGGIAEIFPRYPWLGELITGAVFLLVPVIAVMIGMRVVTRTFKSTTVHKYEARQRQQRHSFGTDVRDPAPGGGRPGGEPH